MILCRSFLYRPRPHVDKQISCAQYSAYAATKTKEKNRENTGFFCCCCWLECFQAITVAVESVKNPFAQELRHEQLADAPSA